MAIRLINPNSKYDYSKEDSRTPFVNAMKDLSDLEKWLQGIQENPNSLDIREKLGKLTLNNPNAFVSQPTDFVTKQLEEGYSDSIEHIGGSIARDGDKLIIQKGYTENNFDDMFNRLDPKNILDIMQNITLLNTGKEKVDEAIKYIRESQAMQRIDSSTVHPFISRKMKEEPKYLQAVYFSCGRGNAAYTQSLIQYFAEKNSKELTESVRNIGKQSEKGNLKEIINSSLEVAKDLYNDEKHLGDKSDIFEGMIRPTYLGLAKSVYPLDKEMGKWENDKDRVKRKEKIRDLTRTPPKLTNGIGQDVTRKRYRMAA